MKALITAALLVATVVLTGCSSETTPSKKENSVKANWRYVEHVDQMSDNITKIAATNSSNKVEMKFPYNGGVGARIIVTDNSVSIHVSKGQVMCQSYTPCNIRVKFDGEKPELYSAIGPSNGHTTFVRLNEDKDIAKFKNKLKTANRVMISMEMYQENSPVWEFTVSGFYPDKL